MDQYYCFMLYLAALLKIPLYFLQAIWSGLSILGHNGLKSYGRYIVAFVCLSLKRHLNKRRLDLYATNFPAATSMEEAGFVSNSVEWEIECPQTTRHIEEQFTDEIFFNGLNNDGDEFFLRFSRFAPKICEIQFLLKFKNETYILDKEHHIDTSGPEEFQGGGFRLQCLSPNRKWRIHFNGILRRKSDGSKLHVKIYMLWFGMQRPVDHLDDNLPAYLSKAIATSDSDDGLCNDIIRCGIGDDAWSQAGNMKSAIFIGTESDEEELYLWGYRFRSKQSLAEATQREQHFIGVTKDGCMVYILQKPENKYNYARGSSILFANAKIYKYLNMEVRKSSGNLTSVDNHTIFTFDSESFLDKRTNDVIRFVQKHADAVFGESAQVTLSGCNMATWDEVGVGHIVTIQRKLPEIPTELNDILEISVDRRLSQTDVGRFCVGLDDIACRHEAVSGGKGSSLAMLTSIAEKSAELFEVPKGVIVTTHAYALFRLNIIQAITNLETEATTENVDLATLCKTTVKSIQSQVLPAAIADSIEKSLLSQFDVQNIDDLSDRQFAVRSSAVGEDSQDMSAAGQMETFLGVSGLTEICQAVVKCWSSQFGYVAIQYKRRYGLRLDNPMAVVIQEMVPADKAGVMFTCDPLTGNPSVINITANFGLGESVVSASADPDTIVVSRHENQFDISNKFMGKKKTQIFVNSEGGTTTKSDVSSNEFCISDDESIRISKAGDFVERYYGSLRDIEWAIIASRLYLLQSRPITSISKMTEFETIHNSDTPLRSENEFFTKANVGEVMPLALTPLGGRFLWHFFETFLMKAASKRNGFPGKPQFWGAAWTLISHGHFFFQLAMGMFRTEKDASLAVKAFTYSMLARDYYHEDLARVGRKRKLEIPLWKRIRMSFYIFFDYMNTTSYFKWAEKYLKSTTINLSTCVNSREMLERIYQESQQLFAVGHTGLTRGTMTSMFGNMTILLTLGKIKNDIDTEVFSDFSQLITTQASDVESADVPQNINNLANALSQSSRDFESMNPEDARKWLETSNENAARAYREFIQKHGHRCVMEFDMYSTTWREDPIPIIKTLQSIVEMRKKAPPNTTPQTKAENNPSKVDFDQLILGPLLTWKQRLILKFFVPRARKGVGYRECGKSLLIRAVDHGRVAMRKLGAKLVEEGRIPEPDLVFFFTFEEIGRVTKEPCPLYVSYAIQRRSLKPKMDAFKFTFIDHGIPKPYSEETSFSSLHTMDDVIKGTPVSRGTIEGFVRVVRTLQEAPNIKKNEILVAEGTDTGWTPYFPLLSGVVTELGGLLSHGAVVAREYGMPCVVGIEHATRIFKTGDYIHLDGTKGIVKWIIKT